MVGKRMDDKNEVTTPPTAPGDVVKAWNDLILFADRQGTVLTTKGVWLSFLPEARPEGAFFWEALGLGTDDLESTLKRFPPFQVHEVSCGAQGSLLLRAIPLSPAISPESGYVIIATDNQPMEALHENYEEKLEDNITAWSDSITLFNSFFDSALDATFLIDHMGAIIAANTAAQKQHEQSENRLIGDDVKRLLGKRFHGALEEAMRTLRERELWKKHIVAIDAEGEGFPAEATLRKISLTSYSLFQLIIHDLTSHVELEENLQEKMAEVREKEIALRHVIMSVEEERRELREQLASQVKKQVLPALERITTSDTPEIREGYKSVIEDQLVDLAGDTTGGMDSDLLRLSPREIEVCRLIQLGRSGKEIADLLSMSFETVQTHRKNIRRKLGLQGKKTPLFNYLCKKPSLA